MKKNKMRKEKLTAEERAMEILMMNTANLCREITEERAIQAMIEFGNEFAKQRAIAFDEWLFENDWKLQTNGCYQYPFGKNRIEKSYKQLYEIFEKETKQ